MDCIVIQSYLKVGDNFMEISDFCGPLEDHDYINGAIDFRINKTTIIDKSDWDYIDQLWSYILNGVYSIHKGKNFYTYFPDQPIKLSFSIKSKHTILVSRSNDGLEVSICIDKNLLTKCLLEGAGVFFAKIGPLIPDWDTSESKGILDYFSNKD